MSRRRSNEEESRQFSKTPTTINRAAPWLGEHTRTILREHGCDDSAIDALAADGVVAWAGAD